MKRIIYIVILLMPIMVLGQTAGEALMYSQLSPNGTARFNGLGGAYTSLGGDFSSIAINPAGLGVYRSSEFVFTTDFSKLNSETKYLGRSYEETNFDLSLNNLGYVGSVSLGEEGGWMNINFGLGYNKLADFSRNSIFSGVNNKSSYLDFMVDKALDAMGGGAFNSDNLDDFYGFPAFEAYMIDTFSVGNTTYIFHPFGDNTNNGEGNYGQTEVRTYDENGKVGEWAFAVGGNLGNQFYFGGSVNIQTIRYEYDVTHFESANNANDHGMTSFKFVESFKEWGTGVNAKFGVIYKPIEFMRLGASVHTPTFYSMDNEFYTFAQANYSKGAAVRSKESVKNEYSYDYRTPARYNFGASFISKLGLLSVDYEIVDYSSMKLKTSDGVFDEGIQNENDFVKDNYKTVGNLRIGAELKLNQFRVRGGYSLNPNPVKQNDSNKYGIGDVQTYSCGVGYYSQNYFVDLAFMRRAYDNNQFVYRTEKDGGIEMSGKETFNRDSFTATVGFKF